MKYKILTLLEKNAKMSVKEISEELKRDGKEFSNNNIALIIVLYVGGAVLIASIISDSSFLMSTLFLALIFTFT